MESISKDVFSLGLGALALSKEGKNEGLRTLKPLGAGTGNLVMEIYGSKR